MILNGNKVLKNGKTAFEGFDGTTFSKNCLLFLVKFLQASIYRQYKKQGKGCISVFLFTAE